MLRFVFRRLLASALLLWIVLTLVFFAIRAAPGDPLIRAADQEVSPIQAERLRALYGFDRPVVEQYLDWLHGVVVRWEWGLSITYLKPAGLAVIELMPPTLLLAALILMVQYGLGIVLGVTTALRANGALDLAIRSCSLVLYSAPTFWLGLMAILIFSHGLGWFPSGNLESTFSSDFSPFQRLLDRVYHLALPALSIGVMLSTEVSRLVRNTLLDVLSSDFIRAARARGLSRTRVVYRHALRHTLTPLIQVAGITVPLALSGSIVIEVVFNLPGLGSAFANAIASRDAALVLAISAFSSFLVVCARFVVEVIEAAVDPRATRVES